MKPIVRALGTAVGPLYATQREAFEYLDAHFPLEPEERDLYRRILTGGPIAGRFFGMDHKGEAGETDPDALLARFLKFARRLGVEAASRALERACLSPESIDGLVVNTCTGYLCPGLTSYVAEDLGLRTDIRLLDLMGMGCGAAIPAWEAAAGMLARSPCGPVLTIAVEICSATMFMGPQPDLVISNCIFGDGAAAAVLDRPESDAEARLRLIDFGSGLYPRRREDLRYHTVGGRLRNRVSKRVPRLGAKTAAGVADGLLQRHGLDRSSIRWWAVHAGGSAVLDEVARRLMLDEQALRHSRAVFREYGNMSSPTVLFVLERLLRDESPATGDRGLILSFGAGFSAFVALVEF